MAGIHKSIKCDYCPRTITWQMPPTVSNGHAMYRARKAGWSLGKTNKCPNCKRRRSVL